MSYVKHLRTGLKWLCDYELSKDIKQLPIEDNEYIEKYPVAHKYAMEQLEKEIAQASEGLYHNLNTLESRQGSQVPFTSINLGRDTSPEGRMIIKGIFNASLNGIGKFHKTSIFPISIFQHKRGCNANPGDPNYDMKQLALKSLAKRIYPNFVNCDWAEAHETEGDIDTYFATMGCRTMIGYDRHGLGYTRQGRGNNVPNTIILPKIGIENGICLGKREKPDIEGFYKGLDEALRLCEKGLLNRYEIIKKQSPEAAPFMYQNGTMQFAKDCKDTVEESVKHNTLAVGLIGMAETCVAMFGKNHAESEEAREFALGVIQYMSNFVKECCERNDLNFSLYFTPAEGLCRTALVALRKQYGVIENVTSHEYLTNSCHVPVWQKISIFDKLRIESQFTKYATGGVITYIELESTFMNNTKAIEDIIDFAFSPEIDIPYLAFNFPIDTCLECGYQGEFNDCCPMCGSDNIEQLRRVTGYLSADYRRFNKGKIAEVEERVKHTAYTDFGKEGFSNDESK